jgi:hypothetical protein
MAKKASRKKSSGAKPRRNKARGASDIQIKRAYDDPGNDDGLRILIDRLWPRGMPKIEAQARRLGEASLAE